MGLELGIEGTKLGISVKALLSFCPVTSAVLVPMNHHHHHRRPLHKIQAGESK